MQNLAIKKQFKITVYEKEILITTPSNRKNAYQVVISFKDAKRMHLLDKFGQKNDWLETKESELNYYECCGVLILFGIVPPTFEELYFKLKSSTVESIIVLD